MSLARKSWWELKVEPIAGEPLRYHVESVSYPEHPHLVDLAENEGFGACSCQDFTLRREDFLANGAPPQTNRTACSHLRAAFRVFGIWAVRAVATSRHQPLTPSSE
jgi:hypothetical protein